MEDIFGEASRAGPNGRPERIDDKDFLAWIYEILGEKPASLIQSVQLGPASPALLPLDGLDDKELRRLRLVVASDASRACLKRAHGAELTFSPDGNLEMWPSSRISLPPTDAEEVCYKTKYELPGAMAIIHLVQGRLRGKGYYAHEPKGLANSEAEQILTFMSVRTWRRALEMRHGLHLAFRAPYHVAGADSIDHPHLRNFVSLEEQKRTWVSD